MQIHRRPPAYVSSVDPARPWANDQLRVTTTVALGFWERLRVLCHGSVVVQTSTSTERTMGRTETDTLARVPRVWPLLARRRKSERPVAVTPPGALDTEEPTRRAV